MAESEDQEIISFALKAHFITPEIVETCKAIQKELSPTPHLSTILLSKGFISPEQYRYLRNLLYEGTRRMDAITKERKVDSLFGKLAVAKGYITSDELDECLQIQSELVRTGKFYRLGKILLDKGRLTTSEIEDILKDQNKSILTCPKCGSSYNMQNYDPSVTPACSHCGIVLNFNKKPTTDQLASSHDLQTTVAKPPSNSEILATLVVSQGADQGKICYVTSNCEFTVGRIQGLSLSLNDPTVSRVHCKIISTPSRRLVIIDLMSSHGTYVNGNKIQQYELQNKDKIKVGKTYLELRIN